MNIRFDRTEFAVTAYCTCGWVDLTLGIDSARRIAIDHETRAHPECRQVREAARMRVTRELRNSP